MIFYQKTNNKISLAKTAPLSAEIILQEASKYQLVKVCRVAWERLDDDRCGSSFDVYYYPLQDVDNCPIEFAIVVENNHFVGVALKHDSEDNWPTTIGKRVTSNLCVLLVDSTVVGKNEIVETYDTLNNQDIVKIAYSLSKLA